MQKYKTIEDKVKVILTSQTDTRDDDMKFYLCVCRYCQPSIGTMRAIGSTEFVVGHNPNSPNPYVCWYCKNGSDYFWGYYCNTLEGSKAKFHERCQLQERHLRDTHQITLKSKDDHER